MRTHAAQKQSWGAYFEAENDPTCAADLREEPLSKRILPSNQITDRNNAWGLARTFSDLLREKGLLICGLDLPQTQRFAAYMSALLNEAALNPDQIRDMFGDYVARAQTRQIKSHVGYFWCLREELARAVTSLAPVIADPPTWSTEQAPAAPVEWSW